MQETKRHGLEDLLENDMTTYINILAWEIPWTEEPGGLQSMCAKALQLCWTLCNSMDLACQGFLSMGFSGQEYWGGLPCPPAGTLPNPGIKPVSVTSPSFADGFFITRTTWEAPHNTLKV